MPDGNLYDEDFHAWALAQADKLRAVAGVQAPELEGVDFEHIIEEVEDLGHSERRKVESNLEVALRHIIKIACLPETEYVSHWKREVNAFLDSAQDNYLPSMSDRIDLDRLWEKARRRTNRDLHEDGFIVPFIPDRNPFTLEQLLDEDFDPDSLVAILVTDMQPRTDR